MQRQTQSPGRGPRRTLSKGDDEERPPLAPVNAAARAPQQPNAPAAGAEPAPKEEPKEKPKEPATPAADANNRVSVRLLQSLAIYLTLVPVIVIIALKEVYFREGLFTGLACSGLLTAVHTAFWGFKWKKEPPYMLDVALTIYFTVFVALYETMWEYRVYLQVYLNITIHGWLALVMLVSLAARYPWVLQHAKEVAPQIAWQSRTFRTVVDQVTGAWAASQALTCLLCVVPFEMESEFKDPLNIVFNYVVPYLLMVVMLGLTKWWPRFIRIKYYLPRMHQGSIKPGEAAAGTEGAEAKDKGKEQQPPVAGQGQQPQQGQQQAPNPQQGQQQAPNPQQQQQSPGQQQGQQLGPVQQSAGGSTYPPMQSAGGSTYPPMQSAGGSAYPPMQQGQPQQGPMQQGGPAVNTSPAPGQFATPYQSVPPSPYPRPVAGYGPPMMSPGPGPGYGPQQAAGVQYPAPSPNPPPNMQTPLRR